MTDTSYWLPPAEVLQGLLGLLHRLRMYNQGNGLTASSLGAAMGPLLFRPQHSDRAQSSEDIHSWVASAVSHLWLEDAWQLDKGVRAGIAATWHVRQALQATLCLQIGGAAAMIRHFEYLFLGTRIDHGDLSHRAGAEQRARHREKQATPLEAAPQQARAAFQSG